MSRWPLLLGSLIGCLFLVATGCARRGPREVSAPVAVPAEPTPQTDSYASLSAEVKEASQLYLASVGGGGAKTDAEKLVRESAANLAKMSNQNMD